MTTHNGRGQDGNSGIPGDSQLPATTPPHEGVVLPAHGDSWTPEQQHVPSAQAQVQPPAGQPWGQPWGPGSEAGLPVPGAQGPVPGGHGPAPSGQGPDGAPPQAAAQPPAAAQPLPPEGAPAPAPMPPSHAPSAPGGAPDAGHGLPQPDTGDYGQLYAEQPLPGADAYGRSTSGSGDYGTGAGDYGAGTGDYGQPLPGGTGAHGLPQPGAQLGAQASYGQPAPGGTQAGGTQGRHALPPTDAAQPSPSSAPLPVPHAAPPPPALPPEHAPGGDSESTQMLPPVTGEGPQHIGMAMDARQGHGQGPGYGQSGSEDGTQLLPPQPPAPMGDSDAEATQYIPPVTGDSEATHLLSAPVPPGGAGPMGSQGQPGPGQGPPAGGGRQTLPEFESLFRAEPSSPGQVDDSPGSTQSLPIFDQAAAQQHERQRAGVHGEQGFDQYESQSRAARRNAERGRTRRPVPPGLLIGAGLAGVAVIGVLVGIGLSGGDDKSPAANKKEASTAPAGQEKSSPPPDPAEGQSKKLDAILGDSNNSRSAVVRSVERIKSCKRLGKAAADLRAAAKQRTSLVTRLGQLETDKIPNSAALNSALTGAWKSSAAADNHYAAWADQAGKKRGCHKGKARGTGHTVAGDRASGAATVAKKKAAELWNPTAQKYGLKERQFSAL